MYWLHSQGWFAFENLFSKEPRGGQQAGEVAQRGWQAGEEVQAPCKPGDASSILLEKTGAGSALVSGSSFGEKADRQLSLQTVGSELLLGDIFGYVQMELIFLFKVLKSCYIENAKRK